MNYDDQRTNLIAKTFLAISIILFCIFALFLILFLERFKSIRNELIQKKQAVKI